MTAELTRFFLGFVLTAIGVAVTAVLGLRHRRRLHIASALVTTALLVYTIYLAEMLGRTMVFPKLILWIHLSFANAATIALIVVIVRGVALARRGDPARRRKHRLSAWVFAALVGIATATGVYMVSQGTVKTETARPPGE